MDANSKKDHKSTSISTSKNKKRTGKLNPIQGKEENDKD